MKKQSLYIAALGMGMLSVQAENLTPSPECVRLGLALSEKSHSGASFAWRTQTSAAASNRVTLRAIAVWGDSLTSDRDFINAALSTSGISKETVLPSFIQAGMSVRGLRLPLKTGCASKGWQVAYAHKEKRNQAEFSKGLLSLSSATPGDSMYLDFRFPLPSTRVKRLTLLYEKPKPDSSLLLAVSVDDGDESFIPLSRTSGSALQIEPAAPMAVFKMRVVSGTMTVHGFAPSYQQPAAAILDALSIPGGLLRSWSNTSERFFAAPSELAANYSIVVVQYGTNEGADAGFSRENYVGYLRANLGRLRKFYPRPRCILIGPPDRGVVDSIGRPGALKYSNLHHQIALAQKQVGLEYRCEFWDWQAAMGGPGSALRWTRMTPPQMQADLTHLTAKGYQVSGQMFAEALLLDKN